MSTQDFKRKLTAIMSADVAGYSRLMGDDEAATVKTLEAYKQVMFSLIKQHRGRVVDSPGDNLLAEFASVVDAVQCGVAVQNELKARNADLPENRKMEFRVGINLGDVIEEEDRIYGDGVNIAARLESCADPGGICVSKTTFDHIETKLPLGYEYLGEKEVKNISKPVGAYRVLMQPRVTIAGAKDKKPRVPVWRRIGVLAGAFAALIAIIGAGLWNFHFRPQAIERASKEKMAVPLPDKPSIAVLPFVNLSGDPKQELFCDGLTEDLITALSKVPSLFVIASNSTFTYKGKPVKVQQVAENLGIRYVLEGSIQKSGDRVRITAQLIDALKGNHVWSERYEAEMKEIFALQDRIALETLKALDVKLVYGEGARITGKNADNLEAYIKLMQCRRLVEQYNKESTVQARQLAEEAIRLDPRWHAGYFGLAVVNELEVWLGMSKSPRESLMKAIELDQKALSLDASDAIVQSNLGYLYVMIREYEKGIAACERAIEIGPNSADAYLTYAVVLNYSGRAEEAVAFLEKAFRLNPFPSAFYYMDGSVIYRNVGRYEDGVKVCKECIARWPKNIVCNLNLAANNAALGRDEEARAAAQDVLRIDPKFSTQRFLKNSPYKDPALTARALELYRKAGLPD
jgi:adenylate cyclase